MRNLIFGVAALLAAAAPGAALAQSGYVDASYASSEVEAGGLEADGDGWAVGGAYAFDAHALGFQIDAEIGNAEVDGGDDTDSWNLGGHVFTRNANWLLGGAVNFGNVESGGADADFWTVAAEGQLYLDRTTLDAAVSYSEAEDAELEVTAVDLGATYFITDNFSVEGGVGFASLEGGGADADVTSLGVGAEYQLESIPVSIFGGYAHSEIDDFDADANTLSIGVRYNWGGTLFDRNRSGASLSRGGIGRFLGLI